MLRRLPALLLLALGACSVDLTPQDALWFDPAGQLWTDGLLVVAVGSRGVDEVELYVDGNHRGRWRTGASHPVRLNLAPGQHRLEARGSGFKGPLSAAATVTVEPFSIVSITPRPGKVPMGMNPEFTVQFSSPVSLQAFEASNLMRCCPLTTLGDLPHGLVDARTIRFQIPWNLAFDGTLSVDLIAAPLSGAPRHLGVFSWSERAVQVQFREVPLAVPPCAGVHRWTVEAAGDVPPSGMVTCGAQVVASLGGPAPWTFDVDLDAQPEGYCLLGFESPGTRVAVYRTYGEGALTVDRTPPRLISTDVPRGYLYAGQIRWSPTISLLFSEYTPGNPSVTYNGVEVSTYAVQGYGNELHVSVPYSDPVGTIAIGPGTLHDLCLNPAEPFSAVFDVKQWFAPFGDGPLLGGAKVAAGAAWLEENPLQAASYLQVPDGYIAWIPAPGEPSEGSLQVSVVSAGNTYRRQLSSGAPVSAFEEADAVIAWREATPTNSVRLAFWNMEALDWAFPGPPRSLAGVDAPQVRFTWFPGDMVGFPLHSGGVIEVAWAEIRPDGAPMVLVVNGTTSATAFGGEQRTPASMTAGVQSFKYEVCANEGRMAWLQDDGSGPRVHALGGNGASASSGPIDLAGPSSSLSLGCVPLWIEGEQAYYSYLGPDGATWVAPIQVQLPPGATAASPVWYLGTITLVVRTPGADEIRLVVLEPDGTQRLAPDVVNQGVPGRVRSLSASGSTLSWIDDAGQLWARTYKL